MEFNLTTERFLIRKLQIEDVGPEYLSWFQNEDVKKYIFFQVNENEELKKLSDYVSGKAANSDILFLGVFNKSNPTEHIGNIKFEPFDVKNCVAVMGILIGNRNWKGKGVGFEVLNSCMDKIEQLGIKKTFLGVEKTNLSAVRLYEKCNFLIDESNFLNLDLKTYLCMVRYSSHL